MSCIALIAEDMQHHPDWYNVYNNLKIQLNTHDVQGISIKDFYLASAIEHLSDIFNQNPK